MDYTKIEAFKERLRATMPERRYQHTLRTLNMAMELAMGTEADKDVVYYAALLHDCAKIIKPTKEQEAEIADFLGFDAIVHAGLGAVVAREDYGITDERILNAIRYHATGRAGMSIEEQIVCLADAIEDGREYPTVAYIREETKKSLRDGMIANLESVVAHVGNDGGALHHLTLEALNDLKGEEYGKN